MIDFSPGIYHGIKAADYHALPYVSNSYLKKLDKCPAAAKVETEDTPAMALGRACHVLTLEGFDAFNSEFVILPDDAPRRPTERQRNASKPSVDTLYACEFWDEFNANSEGKETVTSEDYKTLCAMRESVHSHPFAKSLLAEGVSETSVIFDQTIDGQKLRCKCRPDRTPSPEMRTLIDLKTTDEAGHDAFMRSCLKYGYITQGAFYIDGYNSVRGDNPEMDAFVFIAVEKKPPYRCEVYVVDHDFLKWGRNEYQRLMRIEIACRKAGVWPNYVNAGADELVKPAWLV